MIKLAIVSPCYNEQECLSQSIMKLLSLLDNLESVKKISTDSYILLVDDGSVDDTWAIIQDVHKKDPRAKAIRLSQNYGHQKALYAGMMAARSNIDAVITIDADLQDDLSSIGAMLNYFEEGYDIVCGVKSDRKNDKIGKRVFAGLYYFLLQTLHVKTISNHADFRLLSKRALDELLLYRERNLYLRGLIPLLGLPIATVKDVIGKREKGKSKFTIQKQIRLAADGITSFSTGPINCILVVGLIMFAIAFCIFIYVIISLLSNHYTSGWASLMLSVWFIGAVITLSIGVVGIYIGKIYMEVKKRPLFRISERLD